MKPTPKPQQKASPQLKGGSPSVSGIKVADLKAPGGRGRLSVPCALSLYPWTIPAHPRHLLWDTVICGMGDLASFQPRSAPQTSSCVHRQSYVQIMERGEWDRSKQGRQKCKLPFQNPFTLHALLLLGKPIQKRAWVTVGFVGVWIPKTQLHLQGGRAEKSRTLNKGRVPGRAELPHIQPRHREPEGCRGAAAPEPWTGVKPHGKCI